MTVYAGNYAELYDLFYADKPYDEEVALTDGLLRQHAKGPSHRLLDVACGTGQHAVRFGERGWTVVGIDQSADMLSRARSRTTDDKVTYVQQDMRKLKVPDSSFDAAVCLFDSIGYAVTNDGIGQTLTGIRRAVRREGLFVAEFWHAPPMLRSFEPIRERAWETPDGRVERTSRTRLDVATSTARVEYEVRRFTTSGVRAETWRESHQNRYFMVLEMDLLLRTAGFKPIIWLAGYNEAATIDESTWHVVVAARSAGGPS
jgi:SAM-dependent methyltransferase